MAAKKTTSTRATKAEPAASSATTAAKAKPKVRPMTKTELFAKLSELTELNKKDIANVFEHLQELIRVSLTKRGGPKQFVLPGLLKIRLAERKATPAKKGRNPRDGSIIDIPAKPKRLTVKATPLKALKDSVLTK